MTDLPYFKFMVNDWLGGSIQAHDMETQGVFVNICARAWKNGGKVKADDRLARLLRIDKQVLSNCLALLVEDGLLVKSGSDFVSSKFILLQLKQQETLHDKRSAAGRKGGIAKHLKRVSKCQANAKQVSSIPESESESESDTESEGDISAREGVSEQWLEMHPEFTELIKYNVNRETYIRLLQRYPNADIQKAVTDATLAYDCNPSGKYTVEDLLRFKLSDSDKQNAPAEVSDALKRLAERSKPGYKAKPKQAPF